MSVINFHRNVSLHNLGALGVLMLLVLIGLGWYWNHVISRVEAAYATEMEVSGLLLQNIQESRMK